MVAAFIQRDFYRVVKAERGMSGIKRSAAFSLLNTCWSLIISTKMDSFRNTINKNKQEVIQSFLLSVRLVTFCLFGETFNEEAA